MNLSNTGGGGRGDDKGDVVGAVILHSMSSFYCKLFAIILCSDKKQFWLRGGSYHYHHGMKAGENTLDALVTRVATQSVLQQRSFVKQDFLNRYIQFMTTPGSHNDTYAGTCHRMFFKNWRDGIAPEQCPDNDSHNVDAIDALMIVPPIALLHLQSTPEVRAQAIKAAIQTTRNSTIVLDYANVYADMLLSVVKGSSITDAAINAGRQIGLDVAVVARRLTSDPMVACYIDSSFPALLIFAYRYGDQGIEALLLASTNAGGENVARGSLLGALAGAKYGRSGLPESLVRGLVLSDELQRESSELSDLICG